MLIGQQGKAREPASQPDLRMHLPIMLCAANRGNARGYPLGTLRRFYASIPRAKLAVFM